MPGIKPKLAKLMKMQQGRCGKCKLFLNSDNVIEIHHNDGNHGNNKYENLVLLHGHCHDIIHSKGMYDKHQISRGAV